jgi:hypothetical protein
MSVRKVAYFVLATCASAVAWNAMPFRIAPSVTAERIRKIQPGMLDAELQKLLGTPLFTQQSGTNGSLLFYAHDTPLVNHSPTVWVSVENGKVRQVEAKRTVWFVDDEGLYVRREGLSWESPKFAKTFR